MSHIVNAFNIPIQPSSTCSYTLCELAAFDAAKLFINRPENQAIYNKSSEAQAITDECFRPVIRYSYASVKIVNSIKILLLKQIAMSDENKNKPDNKDDKFEKEKREMDKELKQTFPASDPPSRSRPGHKRTEDDDDES